MKNKLSFGSVSPTNSMVKHLFHLSNEAGERRTDCGLVLVGVWHLVTEPVEGVSQWCGEAGMRSRWREVAWQDRISRQQVEVDLGGMEWDLEKAIKSMQHATENILVKEKQPRT